MKDKCAIVPVRPGTLLRMFPDRQTDARFFQRTKILGRGIPFGGTFVLEVKSYILDKEGEHVTFEREAGTFHVMGGTVRNNCLLIATAVPGVDAFHLQVFLYPQGNSSGPFSCLTNGNCMIYCT